VEEERIFFLRYNRHSGDRLCPLMKFRLLKLLVEGFRYQSAAAELRVTVQAIGLHVQHIRGKLRVHSKSEAVDCALREDYLG
jgi:DNA-binding NarL/FixJ family response regulator